MNFILFRCCICFDVIMHALIKCIDRLTVTTGAELKRFINMTGIRHMPICNDGGEADCVEVLQLIILREESDFTVSMFSNSSAACSSFPLPAYLYNSISLHFCSMCSCPSCSAFKLPSNTHHMLVSSNTDSSSSKRSHIAPIR